MPRFVAGNQAVFSSSWTYQDLAIPQLATIGNIGPVVKGPSGEPLSTRVTFDGLPVVRANFNCTPVTRQHQACTGSLQDVGDKFTTEGTLNGTGYFGAMTSTRSVLGTDPNCPDVLVTFGHTRKLTIDEISHLVCTPYAEQVIISATFQLPSFDLDTPSSSSTPPVTIHPSPPRIIPSINMTDFMWEFSNMVFSNPASLDPALEAGSLFGLAINGRGGTPAAELSGPANIGNLQNAIERTFRLVMAQFLNNARQPLNSPATNEDTITGIVTTPNEGRSRLYQSAISTRILEGLLGVMFVCVVLSYSMQRQMRKLLPKNPCSVGAGASLLAGSDLLRQIPAGAEWMGDEERRGLEVFREGLFGLGLWGVDMASVEGDRVDGGEGGGGKWFGIDFEWADGKDEDGDGE